MRIWANMYFYPRKSLYILKCVIWMKIQMYTHLFLMLVYPDESVNPSAERK